MTRKIFKELIYSIYYFILIYAVVIFLSDVILQKNKMYQLLLMIIPFFIGFFIKIKSKNFFAFIGLNGALFFSLLLLPVDFLFKITVSIFGAMMIVFFIGSRLDKAKLTISHLIAGCIINALLIMTGKIDIDISISAKLESAYMILSIIMFILVTLYIHLSNFDCSLETITSSNVMPIKKIIKFNNTIIILFIILTTSIISIFTIMGIGNIFIYIGQVFLALLRFLASFFRSSNNLDSSISSSIQEYSEPLYTLSIETRETTLLDYIEKVIIFITPFIIIVFLFIGIVSAVTVMYKKFYSEKNDGDIKEFVKPDISLQKLKKSKFFKNPLLSWSQDNKGKIRKIFYKKIIAHTKKGFNLNLSNTPMEMAEILKDSENLSQLVELYEKSRYSEDAISDSEYFLCKK